jgi:Flp pilus assembly pilin Flp
VHLFHLRTWLGVVLDERGASAVEYALLLAILSAALIMALTAMGQSVTSPMTQIGSELSSS